MRVIKDAKVRRNEILDVSEALFNQKGFDNTTISEIIESVGVARGTIYYHFKSKEDILDALISRQEEMLLMDAKKVASDKSIPVIERFFQTILALNVDKNGSNEITSQMKKPQNALMQQKIHKSMMLNIPPVLLEIIEDGIQEGVFNTEYPYESLEMILAYVNTVFDDLSENITEEQLVTKIQAFIYNLERLFGAKPGSFDKVAEMLIKK